MPKEPQEKQTDLEWVESVVAIGVELGWNVLSTIGQILAAIAGATWPR